MKIIKLRCPSCGSVLETEDGLETFFCKYCGQKIILSEQSPDALKAKVAVKQMGHEERMQMNDLDYKTRMFMLGIEEKRRKDKIALIAIAIGILILLLIPLLLKTMV